MSKTEIQFGSIKVIIEDEKSSVTEIANLTYNTVQALIPEMKIISHEERKQVIEAQMRAQNGIDDCADCDEDCELDDEGSIKHKTAQEKINNLYV